MSAKIKYKGSEVSSVPAGQSATIHCKDQKLTDDIVIESTVSGNLEITENGTKDVTNYASVTVNVPIPSGYIKPSGSVTITENKTVDVTNYASAIVNVPSGGTGGECDKNHIIEVDALPTENIDEAVLYKMGDSYYKYEQALKNIYAVAYGQQISFVDIYIGQGFTVELYYVTTKPTTDIKEYSEAKMYAPVYYVEDEDDCFVYVSGTWISLSAELQMQNSGAITDISKATTDGYYYALVEKGWKTLGSPCVIEVGELPTENIDKDAIYYVKAIGCVDVTVELGSDTISMLEWYESKGMHCNIFNVDTLPTENICETIDNTSWYPYYVRSENKIYTYQGGAWKMLDITDSTLVMGTIKSYYTYGSNGFEILASKDAETNEFVRKVNLWGNGSKYLRYGLSDDGTYYVLYADQLPLDNSMVIASEINGIPVTQLEHSMTSIQTDVYAHLTTLVIPDTITSIGHNSLRRVKSIDVLVIGKGVTLIESGAFNVDISSNYGVKVVYYAGTQEEWEAIDGRYNIRYDTIVYGS